jgi:hypothetical protein
MSARTINLTLCVTFMVFMSCNKPEPLREPKLPLARMDTVARFNPIREIPNAPSRDQLVKILQTAVGEMKKARYSDLPAIYEYLQRLRQVPAVVSVLAEMYRQEQTQNYDSRAFVLGIIGEMRRLDALPFLREVVWRTLPQPGSTKCGLTARELEEIVSVKALQGIAYVRTPEGFQETLKIILEHESPHVKISAIDAYMWNSGDTREAAQKLYQTIPADLHKFVERPRFQRSMDSKVFERRVTDWTTKWARGPQRQ